MPPKKGLATTKKIDKYVYIHEDRESVTAAVKESDLATTSALLDEGISTEKQSHQSYASLISPSKENIDPNDFRGTLKRSNSSEPCQASESSSLVELQQSTLTNSIFPPEHKEHSLPRVETTGLHNFTETHRSLQRNDTPLERTPRKPNPLHDHNAPSKQKPAHVLQSRSSKSRSKVLELNTSDSTQQLCIPSEPPVYQPSAKMTTMIPGGAFVPPNQQRNLRACMVCSIVRTYTQFMNGGCPNCEEILELAGNSENVNDCTSQVFEGLITVADTSKSWVARYQRLEGYVAGVYATQVEGILPEEIISAIEAAGINYVPRDGSEDQMIPKD
jgi:transcription elongation factor SPT4